MTTDGGVTKKTPGNSTTRSYRRNNDMIKWTKLGAGKEAHRERFVYLIRCASGYHGWINWINGQCDSLAASPVLFPRDLVKVSENHQRLKPISYSPSPPGRRLTQRRQELDRMEVMHDESVWGCILHSIAWHDARAAAQVARRSRAGVNHSREGHIEPSCKHLGMQGPVCKCRAEEDGVPKV